MENKLKLILDNGVMVLVTGDYKLQIEANNGWFDLINDLCNEINTIYITNDREVDMIPLQIKEKYGLLRFYYTYQDRSKEMNAVHTKIDELVRRYEKYSAHICEVCGNEGELANVNGWIKVLCDKHKPKKGHEIDE